MTATPGVLEAVAARQFRPFPSLGGTNLSVQAIGGVYVEVQSYSYGALYQYQPAVRSCVDYIARNVSQLALDLYRRVSDGERKIANDHPAAISLQSPNGWTPGPKLIFNLVADFLVYDNAYLWKFRAPASDQVVLVNVPPSAVGLIGQERFTAEGYRFYRADGTFFDVGPQDVIHWRGYDPENPRAGFSKLETLRQELAADATARQAKTELDKAGGLPRGWIERPPEAGELTNEQFNRLREQITNWGKQSTRKIPILEEGMAFKSASVNPADAQLLESRRFTHTEVNAAYGLQNVPPQSEDERRGVYADVLPPYCESLCSFLDLFLLKDEFQEDDLYLQFNLDEKLRGEPVARWAAMTASAGAPWRTRNEVRALEDLPPVEGGDELILPLNVTEETPGRPALPAPGVMPIQDPNRPPQDGSYREEQGPTPLPSRASLMPRQKQIQLHPGRRLELERQRRNIDTMQGVVQRHFNRVGRAVNQKSLLGHKATSADWERWDRELASDLDRNVSRIVQAEGDLYMFKLAAGSNFDMGQVKNYLRAMSEGAASAINDTFRQEISQLGLDEAMNRTAQHVQSAGTSLGARSTTFAREEAASQAPGFQSRVKTWIADTERHAEFDGDTVGLEEDWPAGFAPGGAPNCACTYAVT